MAEGKHPHVVFCNDSPKRVLVSVIKTTPIKPRKSEALTPTSPGFSDFMVYPWKWGENAHNVTLSPGSASGASSPTGTQTAREADTAPSPDQIRVGSENRAQTITQKLQLLDTVDLRLWQHFNQTSCNEKFWEEKRADVLTTLSLTEIIAKLIIAH